MRIYWSAYELFNIPLYNANSFTTYSFNPPPTLKGIKYSKMLCIDRNEKNHVDFHFYLK